MKLFLSLDTCALRENLLPIFDKPITVQSSLNEARRVVEDCKDSISAYMNRLRLNLVKAYWNLTLKQREPILVAAFSSGLADRLIYIICHDDSKSFGKFKASGVRKKVNSLKVQVSTINGKLLRR